MDRGTEIRPYEPRREPPDWVEMLQTADCAVILKIHTDSTPLGSDGRPPADPADTSCMVFRSFDAAQEFCHAKVQALPQVRCEIYDSHGLARPPLAVVVHPEFQRQGEAGPVWMRRRRLIMTGLVLASAALFWCAASWSKHRERERERRVRAHRRMAREDA